MAGLRAVESLLRTGLDCEVTVFGDEPHPPYSRPPLSKELLGGAFEPAWFRTPLAAHVAWRTSVKVVASDLFARVLTLEDGEEVGYDGLVVATGVRARRLDVEGPAPLTLRTAEDAERLRMAAMRARSAVIVGGGVLGCELASVLTDAGLRVEVVLGAEEVPMRSAIGVALATELRRRHEQRGVVFRVGAAVVAYSGRGVWMSDGSHLEADLVLETVGSVPNTEWLEANGLDLEDGVRCRADLTVVDAEHVVACGDVARFPSARYGNRLIRVEHWAFASESGRQAGRTLAARLGADVAVTAFDPLPTFWTDQLGIRLQGLGLPGLGLDDGRIMEGDLDGAPVLGYHRGDDLVGVVLVERPEAAVGYRDLL